MKHRYLLISLILFTSCSTMGKKNPSNDSIVSDTIASNKDSSHNLESEYLQIRDKEVEHFKNINFANASDSINALERNALLNLEKRLISILKNSHFGGEGKINLETLYQCMDFGMLDGLSLEKDSMKIFYTSKKLFIDYFKESKIREIDNLSTQDLESIFTSAYIRDAVLYSLSDIKIKSSSDFVEYGLIGSTTNGFGPIAPEYLYVFVSNGDYIYLAEKEIKHFNEIAICKTHWDSIWQETEKKRESNNSSNGIELIDTAMNKYCSLYKKELKKDRQFNTLRKQLEDIAKYLEHEKK